MSVSAVSTLKNFFAAGIVSTIAFLPFMETLPAQAQLGTYDPSGSYNFCQEFDRRNRRDLRQRLNTTYLNLTAIWRQKLAEKNISGYSELPICFYNGSIDTLPGKHYLPYEIGYPYSAIYINMTKMNVLASTPSWGEQTAHLLLIRAYAESIQSARNLPSTQTFSTQTKQQELMVEKITGAFLRSLGLDKRFMEQASWNLGNYYYQYFTNNPTAQERMKALQDGYHDLDLLSKLLLNLGGENLPQCINMGYSSNGILYRVRVSSTDQFLLSYISSYYQLEGSFRLINGNLTQIASFRNKNNAERLVASLINDSVLNNYNVTASCAF